MQKEVLIGMSGGIDSAIAAYLLKKQGYDVTGVFLDLFPSAHDGMEEVLKIAHILNIPVSRYNGHKLFKQYVITPFLQEHLNGRTPSPCIFCNKQVKWKALNDVADTFGIKKIATGHYVEFPTIDNKVRIKKAKDESKDQSYFLWSIPQEILQRAITPLHPYTKKEVKRIANELGLDFLLRKKESSGICFSEGCSTDTLLIKLLREANISVAPGNVINDKNEVIGQHNGYLFYTIGQKKNLKLNSNEKLCVSEILPKTNELKVNTWQNLYTKNITATATYLQDINELEDARNLYVKVRGFGINPNAGCKIIIDVEKMHIELDDPAWAVAPGQPVVVYKNNLVVAAGLIL